MPRAALGDVEIAWDERGSGDAVLFLHGFPFSRRMWQPQLDALPDGWLGIAPDLRGFGESAAPAAPAYTMEQHAADALALLDHLGIERAVVCGLSMGGYIAFALHRTAPARVRALVLADTRAEPDSAEARAQRLEQAERIAANGAADFGDGMLAKVLAPGAAAAVRRQVESMIERTRSETLVRALRGLAERPDSRPGLAAIQVPVLVIGGEEDGITPPDTLRSLAGAIPGARLALLPGAGHVANLEAEPAFSRALVDFLGSLD